jgi:hypothetical protein
VPREVLACLLPVTNECGSDWFACIMATHAHALLGRMECLSEVGQHGSGGLIHPRHDRECYGAHFKRTGSAPVRF